MEKIIHLTTRVLLIAAGLIVLGSCSGEKSEAEEQSESLEVLREMERHVMEVHDAVMPKTADMSALRNRLDALSASTVDDTATLTVIHEANLQLEEADSLMWAWMYGYQRPEEEEHPDSVRQYLQSELKKIEDVRDRMLESIANAESVLEKHQ